MKLTLFTKEYEEKTQKMSYAFGENLSEGGVVGQSVKTPVREMGVHITRNNMSK